MKKLTNYDDYGFPAFLWAVQLLITVVIMFIFTHAVVHGQHSVQRFDHWFEAFAAWDGEWYIKIAQNGYQSVLMTAWFPLYPLLIRITHQIFGLSNLAAGFLISNIAFLAALILLYKLAKAYVGEKKARWTLLLLVSFPTAFFFNMVYTESITLLLTVLFFYLLHKHQFYQAVLIGLIMSSNKQIGVFLILIGFIYLLINHKQYSKTKLIFRIASLCLIPVGLFLYMAVLQQQFGDPFAFVKAQEYWHRQTMIPIIDTIRFMFNLLGENNQDMYFWNYKIMMMTNGILQLLVAAILIWMFVSRNVVIPLQMKVFALLSFLIGTTSGTYGNLQSFGRFMLVIFPVFIVWACIFKRETVLMGTVFLMFAIKVVLLGMFGNGYEIT